VVTTQADARLAEALRLASLGYPIHPCNGHKKPLTENGFKDATTDEKVIRGWWKKWRNANPSVATAGLLLVDLDPGSPWIGIKNRDGSLTASTRAITITPRGGNHYWFRRPEGVGWKCSAGKLAKDTDIRTDGGYALVPPSKTGDGEYQWSPVYGPLSVPPSELTLPPAWLVGELDRHARMKRGGKRGKAAAGGERIPEGGRNSTLASLAGAMRRQGASYAVILAALTEANATQCDPPLDEAEVEAVARSISRYEPEPGRTPGPKPSPNGDGRPPEKPPAVASAAGEQRTGAQVILAYFWARYDPAFKRGGVVVCRDGSELPMNLACAGSDSDLIEALKGATDAPKYQGGTVKEGALPGFFRNWSRVSYGDLLKGLPDEDDAPDAAVAETKELFHRLIRDAMFSEFTTTYKHRDPMTRLKEDQTDRRSVIGWCKLLAKVGPWKEIRSKQCWARLVDRGRGEVQLRVAIRHGLMAQVKADRRLTELKPTTFFSRAERYGVGKKGGQGDRPHGHWALILDDKFVAELTAGLVDDDAAKICTTPESATPPTDPVQKIDRPKPRSTRDQD
jgi:putative DNA primase/helicase